MRRAILTALASVAITTGALGAATPAVAAPTLGTTTGTPLAYQIFGIKGSGTTVYGSAPNNTTSHDVTFTGNSAMDIKNGFAQIDDDTPKTPALNEVIINPNLLFTDMKFSVQLTGALSTGSFTVYYLLAGSGLDPNSFASYTTASAFTGSFSETQNMSANVNYLLSGGIFDGVLIDVTSSSTQDPTHLFELKQISFNPVPEPATWALMLLGFAGVGVAMRRSGKRSPVLTQIA